MKKVNILTIAAGLIAGAGIVMFLSFSMSSDSMIHVQQSKFDTVDETVEALKVSIAANGWNNPGVRNLNKSAEKGGQVLERATRIVEMCNAEVMVGVISTNPELSNMMPCALGVYEGDDGKIYISSMNVKMMANMFGGNVAAVMGETVASAQKKILDPVTD